MTLTTIKPAELQAGDVLISEKVANGTVTTYRGKAKRAVIVEVDRVEPGYVRAIATWTNGNYYMTFSPVWDITVERSV